MKWFTHQTWAVASALALHLPLPGVAGAALGAVLPDVIDQRLARLTPNPQKTFNRIHRGASHWFGWYAALLLLAFYPPVGHALGDAVHELLRLLQVPGLKKSLSSFGSGPLAAVAAGVGFGALSHVLLDMLTPSGVPLNPLSRKNKLSFNVCSTGSLGEYALLALGLLLVLWLGGDTLKLLLR